ncbi:MAG: AAA family ATPase [Candidatus Saccharibacteria bacterium]|nr:AAA family ATPase [Candidatus Saccharibacteria bacterium]
MKIIGLSGTNGSGKDTVGHLLEEKHGYLFADATAMLGAELDKRGLTHERVNKAALSAEWRRESGMGVIIDKALEMFNAGDYKGLIVGSLRHPGEADRVHEIGGMVLWVDADPQIRYDRISANNRGRVEDQKTFEQFLAEEASEMSPSGDAATLNMGAVKEQADYVIQNNGNDIEQFKVDAEKTLASYL